MRVVHLLVRAWFFLGLCVLWGLQWLRSHRAYLVTFGPAALVCSWAPARTVDSWAWLGRVVRGLIFASAFAVLLGVSSATAADREREVEPDAVYVMICDPEWLQQTYGSWWAYFWWLNGCWMY